jgi:hypothetical protein
VERQLRGPGILPHHSQLGNRFTERFKVAIRLEGLGRVDKAEIETEWKGSETKRLWGAWIKQVRRLN